MKHYHVLVGLPGYMADGNYPCRTLAEAGDIAYEEAKSFREEGYASCYGKESLGRVVGNKRWGYEVLRPSIWEGHDWDTWMTIDIVNCYEEECFCEECGELLIEEECSECGCTPF